MGPLLPTASELPVHPRLSVRLSASHVRLRGVVEQHPLLETQPSCAGVEDASPLLSARTVFTGIGLVSGDAVSSAVPLDVMGLLLGAEQVRRTLAADRLVVLVADTHALGNGAPSALLRLRTHQYVRLLRAVAARCQFTQMQVVRASEWERDADYQDTLQSVLRRMPADTDAYVSREVADIAYVERVYGSFVKVGWALQRSAHGALRDERLFDRAYERWIGGRGCFVYSKPGRALDDQRQKVSPYVVADRARRICIDAQEDVVEKLRRTRQSVTRSTYRGVCKHLNAVTRTYSELVRPLEGSVPERAQAMINDLLAEEDTRICEVVSDRGDGGGGSGGGDRLTDVGPT